MLNYLIKPIIITLLTLILSLSACGQKENKSVTGTEITKNQTTTKITSIPFDSIINTLNKKILPVIDTTNYNNTNPHNLFTKQEIITLQLESIYPDFFKETHNYQAQPAYKLDYSKDYHTVAFTIFKGENELESVLVIYDLNGKILDHIIIAYDEIAEGWSRKVAYITNNFIRVDQIFWSEIKEVIQTTYQINNEGKIEEVNSENLRESFEKYTLINSVLQDLKLEWAQIEPGYLMVEKLYKENDETLVMIPEIAREEDDLLQLNTHFVLVNPHTGVITHTLFQSYKENSWQSDAVAIENVQIDPLTYALNENENAFGLRLKYRNNSQPNPYSEETISLYAKENNQLKEVFHYVLNESKGIVNVNACNAEFEKAINKLSFDTSKTKGYFNIFLENIKSQKVFQKDENGECNPTETIVSAQLKTFKYNGNAYQEVKETNHSKPGTTKTTTYQKYQPQELQNVKLPKFSVEQVFEINNLKIASGYYTSLDGKMVSPDTEKEWGDRLVLLDENNKILFQSKGVGDVYAFEPHFYKNPQFDKTIIICQLASEFPFGGDVFILENGNIKYIGMLDIESTEEEKWLTNMVEIQEIGNRIEFTFQSNQLILNPGGENEKRIKNNNLKYVYENNKLFLAK